MDIKPPYMLEKLKKRQSKSPIAYTDATMAGMTGVMILQPPFAMS
jgi:hypothetical protein